LLRRSLTQSQPSGSADRGAGAGDALLCALLKRRRQSHPATVRAESAKEYVKAIDGARSARKMVRAGQPCIGQACRVTDIVEDLCGGFIAIWPPRADCAACWSTPILSGRRKVLGFVRHVYREPQTPTVKRLV